jgi:hypothetical protein
MNYRVELFACISIFEEKGNMLQGLSSGPGSRGSQKNERERVRAFNNAFVATIYVLVQLHRQLLLHNQFESLEEQQKLTFSFHVFVLC